MSGPQCSVVPPVGMGGGFPVPRQSSTLGPRFTYGAGKASNGAGYGGDNRGSFMQAPSQVIPPPAYNGSAHHIRISNFSGVSGDLCRYDTLRYEIQCLINQGVPDSHILSAVRRCTKGVAQETLMHLSPTATLWEVITRFDMVFGDIQPVQVLLSEFYSATQKTGETIIVWYTRLEDMVRKIRTKDPNSISNDMYQLTLNNKFWSGLYSQNVRNALRHKLDQDPASPELFVAARQLETEFFTSAKTHQVATDITPPMEKCLKQMLDRMSGLEEKFQALQTSNSRYQPGGKPWGSYNRPRVGPSQQQQPQHPHDASGQSTLSFQGRPKGKCYRCHKFGHYKSECPLNYSQSAGRNAQLAAEYSVPTL